MHGRVTEGAGHLGLLICCVQYHLPLSASRMVTSWSLWSDDSAFLSWMVRLEGGVFALVSAVDTFSLSCSASVSISLLLLLLVNLHFDGLSGVISLSHRVMDKTIGNGT